MAWMVVFLLRACVALKGVLSLQILSKGWESATLPDGVAIALAFVMPIMNWWNYKSYLAQIAPTIWHNSTTILVMPAVICLFTVSVKCLNFPTLRNTLLQSGL
jgi:hypothetical protein